MKTSIQIGGVIETTTPEETKSVVSNIVRSELGRDKVRGTWIRRVQTVNFPIASGSDSDAVFNFGTPPAGKMWYVTSVVPIAVYEGAYSTFTDVAMNRLGMDGNNIWAVLTTGPARGTGFYSGRQINIGDIIDTYEPQVQVGTFGAEAVSLVSPPRWTSWRYGSSAGLAVMANSELAVTVLVDDYNIGDVLSLTWNVNAMEIDESATIRSGTP